MFAPASTSPIKVRVSWAKLLLDAAMFDWCSWGFLLFHLLNSGWSFYLSVCFQAITFFLFQFHIYRHWLLPIQLILYDWAHLSLYSFSINPVTFDGIVLFRLFSISMLQIILEISLICYALLICLLSIPAFLIVSKLSLIRLIFCFQIAISML